MTAHFLTVDSERLRDEADRILSQPKYRVETTTSERLSTWLRDLWFAFLEFLDSVAGLVGGPLVLGLILVVAVVIVAVVLAHNLGRRRARELENRIRREHALARGVDPEELENQADAAASRGDHSEAVRLRFRAGLLRLDESGRIKYRPGLTGAEIEDLLQSPVFDMLARRFDEIVYGRQPASPDDYAEAVAGWRSILAVTVGSAADR